MYMGILFRVVPASGQHEHVCTCLFNVHLSLCVCVCLTSMSFNGQLADKMLVGSALRESETLHLEQVQCIAM